MIRMHCLSKYVVLAALIGGSFSTLLAAQSQPDCAPLPDYVPLNERHGHNHWSDERLRIHSQSSVPVAVPDNWQPVGAQNVLNGCATFPAGQAVVIAHTAHWTKQTFRSGDLGIEIRLFTPRTTPQSERTAYRERLENTFKQVSSLFPLGLGENQRAPLDVLVTVGIAGDTRTRDSRIFPAPGPRLIPMFYRLKSGRGKDLLIHTTTHLFNKRRGRLETMPAGRQIALSEYQEFVATWAELAFNHDHGYISKRLARIRLQHELLFDDDADTWPTFSSLSGLADSEGPFGVPPFAPRSKAAREYAHYYLSPLILLGVEGYLATDAPGASVSTFLRGIHAGRYTGLMAVLDNKMPLRYATILRWMKGEEAVPRDLVEQGLVRLHSNANEPALGTTK